MSLEIVGDGSDEVCKLDYFPDVGKGIIQETGEKEMPPETKNIIDISRKRDDFIGEGNETRGRIIIIGDSHVGKTCLMLRFWKNTFQDQHKATIGLDCGEVKYDFFGIPLQVQLFDTAGQERFFALSKKYYRHADAALVCFDLSDYDSFVRLENWVSEVRENCATDDLKVFLVGCKNDKITVFSQEEITLKCEQLQSEYFSTSALLGRNVKKLFDRVSYCLMVSKLKDFWKYYGVDGKAISSPKEQNNNTSFKKRERRKSVHRIESLVEGFTYKSYSIDNNQHPSVGLRTGGENISRGRSNSFSSTCCGGGYNNPSFDGGD